MVVAEPRFTNPVAALFAYTKLFALKEVALVPPFAKGRGLVPPKGVKPSAVVTLLDVSEVHVVAPVADRAVTNWFVQPAAPPYAPSKPPAPFNTKADVTD